MFHGSPTSKDSMPTTATENELVDCQTGSCYVSDFVKDADEIYGYTISFPESPVSMVPVMSIIWEVARHRKCETSAS